MQPAKMKAAFAISGEKPAMPVGKSALELPGISVKPGL